MNASHTRACLALRGAGGPHALTTCLPGLPLTGQLRRTVVFDPHGTATVSSLVVELHGRVDSVREGEPDCVFQHRNLLQSVRRVMAAANHIRDGD